MVTITAYILKDKIYLDGLFFFLSRDLDFDGERFLLGGGETDFLFLAGGEADRFLAAGDGDLFFSGFFAGELFFLSTFLSSSRLSESFLSDGFFFLVDFFLSKENFNHFIF